MRIRDTLLALAALAVSAGPAAGQSEKQREALDEGRAAPVLMERNLRYEVPEFERGAEVPVVRMEWKESDAQTVIDEVETAISIMLEGRELERMDAALKEVLFGNERGSWTRVAAAPEMLVKYQSEFNEFRLINTELDFIRETLGRIGIEQAQARAEKVLNELIRNEVVNAALYDNAVVQVGYRRVGTGSTKGAAEHSRIVEYRITYRPRIEGIELANSGVRVGVLTDGAISSMRVGGVTPAGVIKDGRFEPKDGGTRRKIEASPGHLMTRFYRHLPADAKPVIAWSRVMYAMPDNTRSALLEPRLVISFSEIHQTEDNQRVSSRRRTLGFSLVDAEAKPFDYTAPTKGDGDEVERKEP